MRNISKEAYDAYNNTVRDIRARITIDGKEFNSSHIKEWKIEEGVLSEEYFELGGALSSVFTMTIYNKDNIYTNKYQTGMKVIPEIGIMLSNGIVEYTQIGIFTIDTISKNGMMLEIEAFDNMNILCQKQYICKLKFPTTLKRLLNDILVKCGVVFENTSFHNENLVIPKNPFVEVNDESGEEVNIAVSCRDIIHDIAEASGGFAIMNKRGRLEFINHKKIDFTLDSSKYTDMSIEEGVYIDKIEVNNSYFGGIEPFEANFTISPFEGTYFGNIGISCGDIINIVDRYGKTHETMITEQTITYNGGLNITISSNCMNATQSSTKVESKLDKFGKKYEAKLEVLSDKITSRVGYDDVESIVTQNADSWGLSINGKLKNTNYLFDDTGAKIFNGSLSIYNGEDESSERSFYVSEAGEMTMNGNWIQLGYSEGGVRRKSLGLENGKLVFYDFQNITGDNKPNPVGYIVPVYSPDNSRVGITMACDIGDFFTFGIGNPNTNQMNQIIRIDGAETLNSNSLNHGYRTIFTDSIGYYGSTLNLLNYDFSVGGQIGLAGSGAMVLKTGTKDQTIYFNTSSGSKLKVYNDGIYVWGTVNQSSDVLFKSNIKELEDDVISELKNTKVYSYTKNGKSERGFIAQQAVNSCPNIISGKPSNFTIEEINNMDEEERNALESLFTQEEEDKNHSAGVSLYDSIATLWKVNQIQQDKIESLEQKNIELEQKNNELEQRLAKLEQLLIKEGEE